MVNERRPAEGRAGERSEPVVHRRKSEKQQSRWPPHGPECRRAGAQGAHGCSRPPSAQGGGIAVPPDHEAEATAQIGAGLGERAPAVRTSQRKRLPRAPMGQPRRGLERFIPKQGSYFPSFLEPAYEGRKGLVAVVMKGATSTACRPARWNGRSSSLGPGWVSRRSRGCARLCMSRSSPFSERPRRAATPTRGSTPRWRRCLGASTRSVGRPRPPACWRGRSRLLCDVVSREDAEQALCSIGAASLPSARSMLAACPTGEHASAPRRPLAGGAARAATIQGR